MSKLLNMFKQKSSFKMSLLVILLFIQPLSANAISKKDRDSLLRLPMFKNEKLLQIELKANYFTLLNDIGEDRKYHKCQLQLVGNDEELGKSIEVELMTRGNFRRQKHNCNFPPLRFKIPAKNQPSAKSGFFFITISLSNKALSYSFIFK